MNKKSKPTADEIIQLLKLEPLPSEGGFFRQSYVSSDLVLKANLPPDYSEDKLFCTAIYYLLTAESFSAFHRLKTDELYHFYLGDPAELCMLHPDGSVRLISMGANLLGGQQVQYAVPRGVWQALRVASGGEWTLLGTTMAPGFTQDDFELGKADKLLEEFPDQTDMIRQLTRDEPI